MTEHKFTDEEIIKALEHCGSGYKGDAAERCMECPLDKCGESNCFDTLLHDLSLDLINRQKAEVAYWMDAAANAKKEAVKEFAEKLKKECLFDRGYEILQDGTIDHLAKEFTEA